MKRIVTLVFCVVMLCAGQQAALSGSQIPEEPLEKLQELFTLVRERLWEANDVFWHRGDYDRCIAMMRLVVEVDPHDTQAYGDGAWLMENQLRDTDAEVFLLRGLQHNPDVYDVYFEIGRYYYLRMRFDEAVAYLETAASFDTPPFVDHQLAHALENWGDTTDALSIWLEVEAAWPEDPVPALQIDRILRGGPASRIPEIMTRSREHRKAVELGTENP